jgi:hypothetical protein
VGGIALLPVVGDHPAMETPPGSVRLAVNGRRRPRARWLVLAGALVLFAALAISAYLWASTYAPLQWQGGAYGGGGGSLPAAMVRDGAHDQVIYLDGREPGNYATGFDLTNTGRYAVTLEGLVANDFIRGLKVAPAPNTMDVVPFRPVEIAPGEHRFIQIELSSGQESFCRNYASNTRLGGIDEVRLRYSYMHWFHREVTVTQPFQFVIVCGEIPKPYDAS